MEPTLSQALHLLNGDITTARIGQGNLIGRRLAEKRSPEEIVAELYIRCLSRLPQPAERQKLLALVNAEPDRKRALDDVFWSLLNSREFMFNH